MSCSHGSPSADAVSNGIYTTTRELVRLSVDAQALGLRADRPLTSVWSGQRRSRLRGRGLDFDELRHYHPGDDIRHMDWRVTRRTGQPFVRAYTEEKDRPVLLIVDQRLPMFFGSRLLMKSVATAQAAALLAWATLNSGDRVGWMLIGPQGLAPMPPSRRPQALLERLGALAAMTNDLAAHARLTTQADNKTSNHLSAAMEHAARAVSHDGLIVVLSDFHDWDARCLNHLRSIRRHNEALCFHISDPLERSLEGLTHLVASDGEWQLSLQHPKKTVKQHYRATYTERMETLSASLGRMGVPLLEIDCAQPTAAQLQRQLGRQARSA
ncbi:MAG: DUF58 domain-containing protein [Halieaceae bacterium]|nr:DUF58 domain-containing protein [Halieaceae bacterium]